MGNQINQHKVGKREARVGAGVVEMQGRNPGDCVWGPCGRAPLPCTICSPFLLYPVPTGGHKGPCPTFAPPPPLRELPSRVSTGGHKGPYPYATYCNPFSKNLSAKVSLMKVRLLLLLSIPIIFTLLALPAHAASTGRIFGQLLDGTNKNAPIAGQTVTLQVAQGNNAKDLASVTTDAHGSYSFNTLATDSNTGYALYTRYRGAQYNSDIITLNSKPVQQVNLTVYQTTTSTANIAIIRATILLREPDAQKGSVSVSELYIFRNLDTRTYVGSLNASQGMPNALRFSLPHTARNVALGQEFSGYKVVMVDRGFASDAAIPPGDSQFSFAFDMPYSSSNYDFDYTVVYPTVQLNVLVPPDIHASSDILVSQGPKTANQRPYILFQANALLASKAVHLQLEGLSAAASSSAASNTSFSLPLWLLIGLLIMAAIIFITMLFYRATSHSTSPKKTSQRKPQKQRKNTAAKPQTAQPSDKEKEQALLQELLDLDKAFEAGKLTKKVYQERRAKTKARLRTIMHQKVTP